MNIDDWINSLPDDEREAICTSDAWKAGANAMLDALISHGFVSCHNADAAKKATHDDLFGDSILNKHLPH